MIHVDEMIHATTIIHVMRSIDQPTVPSGLVATPDGSATEDTMGGIIADFRATMVAMKCAMSERLVRLGISMAQLNILYTLQRTGEMPMSRLAELLNVSLSNASGLVDRLEERGLLERTRVREDRRVVLAHITDQGRRMLEEQDALSDDLLRNVLAEFGPTQLQVIARSMAEVRRALEATVGPPGSPSVRQTISTPTPRSR